ncbi:ATP-dependent helicase [Vibrio splendidus]|nr:ATP-dependent helicase [Vibrio splendidus]MCC4880357.1 ATP-dependent helicase [Vibrio splendidus]
MLSKDQLKVQKHRKGHALIVAAPGSGKTTTLAHMIHDMLRDGLTDQDMLVLMFGRDPRVHFEKKLASLCDDYGYSGKMPTIRTYHSLCLAILTSLENKGVLPKHTLETNDTQRELAALNAIRRVTKPAHFKELQNKSSKIADEFLKFIDYVKAELLPPVEGFDALDFKAEFDFFVDAYEVFETERKQSRFRYFSDLIFDLVTFLDSNPQWRSWIGNNKKFVIVDEFQDSNRAQSKLLDYIVGDQGALIACGDVDQSIFTFAGADPGIMLNEFKGKYPKHELYVLPQTYRYSADLADLSNNLIQNNKDRFDTECVSALAEGTKVFMRVSDNFGTDFVNLIKDKVSNGYKYSDIAALVRVYSNAVDLEMALIQNSIPYKMTSSNTCLNSREYRGIVALLAIVSGEDANLDGKERAMMFLDLLRFPVVSIDRKILDAVSNEVEQMRDCSFSKFCKILREREIHPFMKKKLKDLMEVTERLNRIHTTESSVKAVNALDVYTRDIELSEGIKYQSITKGSQEETLDRFTSLRDFVSRENSSAKACFNTMRDMRVNNNKNPDEGSSLDTVTISSVHKSKGLEWAIIYVPEVVSGVWPYEKKDMVTCIETERRLFYVGITRAMKETHIGTNADEYMASCLPGCVEDLSCKQDSSYFLSELEFDAIPVTDKIFRIKAIGT